MIVHMALFSLKHPAGSSEEAEFLREANFLATLRGVEDFRIWRQTCPQTHYDFAISMRFADQNAFEVYMKDPDHLNFAYAKWYPSVARTQDVNCEPAPR